nr:ribonuclease H-like domain-containing protein [Tanacetum cinerariifolium]
MTGNISYFSDFEEINGVYVTFSGNPKGGKIIDKDTERVVLSFDFKPPDENHVLLRVPRENNMYNVDLKNIVLSGDSTCLFTKATLDESNLWHRRVSDLEDESEGEPMPTQKEPSFVQTSKYVKTPRTSIKPVEHPTQAENLRKDIQKSRGHKHSWNKKACFVCKSLNHLIKDSDYYEKRWFKSL